MDELLTKEALFEGIDHASNELFVRHIVGCGFDASSLRSFSLREGPGQTTDGKPVYEDELMGGQWIIASDLSIPQSIELASIAEDLRVETSGISDSKKDISKIAKAIGAFINRQTEYPVTRLSAQELPPIVRGQKNIVYLVPRKHVVVWGSLQQG